MIAKVIHEKHDYGEGYTETKFGVLIGDRYFQVGIEAHNVTPEQIKSDRSLADEIVSRWNAGEFSRNDTHFVYEDDNPSKKPAAILARARIDAWADTLDHEPTAEEVKKIFVNILGELNSLRLIESGRVDEIPAPTGNKISLLLKPDATDDMTDFSRICPFDIETDGA